MAATPPVLAVRLSLGGSYRSAVLADAPVSYWPLRERIGTGATDDVGGHDGTYINTPTLGARGPLPEGGTAAQFLGSSAERVDMGDVSALKLTGDWSIECLIYADDDRPSDSKCILAGFSNSTLQGYSLFLTTSGNIVATAGNGATSIAVTSATLMTAQTWTHVCAVWNGSNLRLYLDGVLDGGPTSLTGPVDYTGMTAFRLGQWHSIVAAQYWDGRLAHAAVYDSALSATRVAAHAAAAAWTDVTTDLDGATGLEMALGIRGSSPMDRVSSPGTCRFALKNDIPVFGLSAYSPDALSVRAGFSHWTPAQVLLTAGGSTREVFRGTVHDIDPAPGIYGSLLVSSVAYDFAQRLHDTKLRAIAPQVSVSEDNLIRYVLDALPPETQPIEVDLAPGLETWVYPLQNLGSGAAAAGVLSDIARSAHGRIWVARNGTIRYRSRLGQMLQTTSYAFTDATLRPGLRIPSTLGYVYNRVRATYHPQIISSVKTDVLWSLTTPMAVEAGETRAFWVTYRDPAFPSDRASGANFFNDGAPVSGTDWTANTQADGGGSNVTASVTYVVEPFVTTAKITATNTTGATAYLIAPTQVRGRLILDQDAQVAESYEAKPYGDRPLDLDLTFQADGNLAGGIAEFVRREYEDVGNQVERIVFNPMATDALRDVALDLQIGDIVEVAETMTTSGQSVPVTVQGITLGVDGGTWLSAELETAPKVVGQVWILDDPVYSELDVTTVPTYG